jgi:hypothetical protein
VRQPLALLIVSSCTGGMMMCVYSVLLVVLNTTTLPASIAPTRLRVGVLVIAALFFGWLTALIVRQQLGF